MNAIQLEFNVDNEVQDEIKLAIMQSQIHKMEESMGKMRRSLFARMGELHGICISLQNENQELKRMIRKLTNDDTAWIYGQDGSLFDEAKNQGAGD